MKIATVVMPSGALMPRDERTALLDAVMGRAHDALTKMEAKAADAIPSAVSRRIKTDRTLRVQLAKDLVGIPPSGEEHAPDDGSDPDDAEHADDGIGRTPRDC